MDSILPDRLLALVRPGNDLVLRRIRNLKRCVQACGCNITTPRYACKMPRSCVSARRAKKTWKKRKPARSQPSQKPARQPAKPASQPRSQPANLFFDSQEPTKPSQKPARRQPKAGQEPTKPAREASQKPAKVKTQRRMRNDQRHLPRRKWTRCWEITARQARRTRRRRPPSQARCWPTGRARTRTCSQPTKSPLRWWRTAQPPTRTRQRPRASQPRCSATTPSHKWTVSLPTSLASRRPCK